MPKMNKFDFKGEEQYLSKTGEMKMLKDIFEQGKEQTKQKIIEVINNLKNPYPLDIFPKLELTQRQSEDINDFLWRYYRITFDRLSAEIMRRARENVKQELLKSIEEI